MQTVLNDPDEYRRELQRQLELNGRSQSALARHLGVHPSAVSRIISGARQVRASELARIDEYLRITGGAPSEPRYSFAANDPAEGRARFGNAASLSVARISAIEIVDPKDTEDYQYVLRETARLLVRLHDCFHETLPTAPADADEALWRAEWFDRAPDKLNALERAGRITGSEVQRFHAVLRIRDLFVNSPGQMSLGDPAAAGALRLATGTWEQDATPPLLRALFGFACSVLALRLVEVNREAVIKAVRDAADRIMDV